jgi:hypothetical protein
MPSGAAPSREVTLATTSRSSTAVSACAGVGRPGQQQRRRVADAPLELAGEPVRRGSAAALGRVTDGELAVLAQEHHRGDGGAVVTEGEDLRVPVATAPRQRCTWCRGSTPSR